MGRENGAARRARREGTKAKKKNAEKKANEKEKSKKKQPEEKSVEDILKELDLEMGKITPKEEVVEAPAPRLHSSFTSHPLKDLILLFGGECEGQRTKVYNELFSYNPGKKQWKQIFLPNQPRPRSAHQAVTTNGSDASLFVFGGEFTSPTGSQFYHFNELWRLPLNVPLAEQAWEQIDTKGAPSPRSGHRMTVYKKKIFVFGGFQDNNRSTPKYFNDVHYFDLTTYKWSKLQFPTVMLLPDPRSAVQIACGADGIFINGGYSIARTKGEIFRGKQHTDSWFLEEFENVEDKSVGLTSSYRWTKIKPSDPVYRTGATMVVKDSKAYSFGGTQDVEEDDIIEGTFFNELYTITLDKKPTWRLLTFEEGKGPSPRDKAHMAIQGNKLYVYGGAIENGNKLLTLSDMYSLDISKKQMEWECLNDNDPRTAELLAECESDSSSCEESDSDDETSAGKKKKKPKGVNPLKQRFLATPKVKVGDGASSAS
eukprot:m.35407 g.35407  ORF g.35407 m.35407 type:complete len:484 (+) comp17133_c0_seq1:91-1542(+)